VVLARQGLVEESQLFFTAEEFTGDSREAVDVEACILGVERLLLTGG